MRQFHAELVNGAKKLISSTGQVELHQNGYFYSVPSVTFKANMTTPSHIAHVRLHSSTNKLEFICETLEADNTDRCDYCITIEYTKV